MMAQTTRTRLFGDLSIFFQDGGRPPSWICDACFGTTHEGHDHVYVYGVVFDQRQTRKGTVHR